MQKETTKAKKRITDLTFDHDGAHLALCSKSQGAANNWNKALIMKSHNFSPEFIQKAQSIQVTLSIPEFLERFYSIWGSDAEVLARLMGYVKPEEDEEEYEDWYENYIEEKLSAFTIIKSLHESKNLPESLSKLTEDEYLSVLTDQALIEKALNAFAKEPSSVADTSTQVEKPVEASASKVQKKKEKNMTQATPEMVEKSALTAIEKAMNETKVELQKALDQVKAFEDEKKQAVIKSKTDAVTALVKDAKQAEVLVKAALALDTQEDFEALVGVVKALVEQVDKSDLFKEVGASASADETKTEESKLAQVIKSKYPKQ